MNMQFDSLGAIPSVFHNILLLVVRFSCKNWDQIFTSRYRGYLLFCCEYHKHCYRVNENISIFTRAKHEWKFECLHYTRWKLLSYSLKKSKFSFYVIVYTTMCASDVITKVTKTKHERHGVNVRCLTCEALERQKENVSANQNNLDTKMFLTF